MLNFFTFLIFSASYSTFSLRLYHYSELGLWVYQDEESLIYELKELNFLNNLSNIEFNLNVHSNYSYFDNQIVNKHFHSSISSDNTIAFDFINENISHILLIKFSKVNTPTSLLTVSFEINQSWMDSDGPKLLERENVFILREGEAIEHAIKNYINESNLKYLEPDYSQNLYEFLENKVLEQYSLKLKNCELAKKYIYQTHFEFGEINIGLGEKRLEVVFFDEWRAPWIYLPYTILDITDIRHFQILFNDIKIDRIKLEHVIEHLKLPDVILALKNIYDYLKPNGRIRIAVPDYYGLIMDYDE